MTRPASTECTASGAGASRVEFRTCPASYRHWRRRHSRDGRPYYLGDAYVDERWAERISDAQMAGSVGRCFIVSGGEAALREAKPVGSTSPR